MTSSSDDQAAGFPGGKLARRAMEKHAQAEVCTWARRDKVTFRWRSAAGSSRPDQRDPRALALILTLADAPRAWSCPWLFSSFDGINEPCAVVRWWLWEPEKPGLLVGSWDPYLGQDWVVRRLHPEENERRNELFKLVIPATPAANRPGRPEKSGLAFETEIDYLESVARFTEKAERQRWDLRNAAVWPAERIAESLEPRAISRSQLFVENGRAHINLSDIRSNRINWTYVDSRRVNL